MSVGNRGCILFLWLARNVGIATRRTAAWPGSRAPETPVAGGTSRAATAAPSRGATVLPGAPGLGWIAYLGNVVAGVCGEVYRTAPYWLPPEVVTELGPVPAAAVAGTAGVSTPVVASIVKMETVFAPLFAA